MSISLFSGGTKVFFRNFDIYREIKKGDAKKRRMVIIGVMSEDSENTIEKLIKRIFSENGIKSVILRGERASTELANEMSAAGVGCMIIALNKQNIRPICFDILILDDAGGMTCDLVKCVFPETRLIYNADSPSMPGFSHPNALSYGMSYRAEATVSSVDHNSDGASFVFCLQRAVSSLRGNILYAGEAPVMLKGATAATEKILAAVACCLICDVRVFEAVNI